MNISFIVKASTNVGYGHLIRSRSLASSIHRLLHVDDKIAFYVIGDDQLKNLLVREPYDVRLFASEHDFIEQSPELALDEVVIFDLLTVTDELFDLTQAASWRISTSPIFSHLEQIDTFFHRSKYFAGELAKVEVFKSLDYAIIQAGCRQIEAATYKRHLQENRMSLAVSMGGGDAANKSLRVIEKLNELKHNFTIWVMLGEGYKHSYDALIEASKQSHHEIILAKTNESMWRVLGLASLLILPGGITTYEAAYAGLPTINIIENDKQRFLVKELLEAGVSEEISGIENDSLIEKVSCLNTNRDKLYEMHLRTKGLIDGEAGARIYEILLQRRTRFNT